MARKSRKGMDAAPEIHNDVVENKVFNAGAYIRLSAVDKKHRGDSIETQQAIIAAFIAEHPGMELRETYIDNGLSGQTFERPAFRRMIADIESKKINCCVTKDLSRLGRNAIDSGYYIEKYFPANGVRFVAVTDGYDSADGNSGGIIVSLKNMANEAVALEIGRKIRATKQMHIREGGFVGRFPPYGFLKNPADKYRLIPDPDAAPVVLRIFQMAADGAGVRDIAKWLNDGGILPPRRYFHSKGLATAKEADCHPHWNKTVLYTVLKNRMYCGDMIQGKYKTYSYVQTKLPESDWIITENTHEAIISRELFAEVQSIWDKSGESLNRQAGARTENIFLRKVFCGHCGHAMSRHRSGKTQYGFSCHTQQMYGEADCVQVSINENMLKERLLSMLREQKIELRSGTGHSTEITDAERAEIREVQAGIERNSRYLKGLYESLVLGDFTDAEFKEMKADYEAKIAALTAKEKALRDAAYDRIRQVAGRTKASGSIRSLRDVSDLTAETVGSLVEKIRVFSDKSIKVKFTFTDEEITLGEAA